VASLLITRPEHDALTFYLSRWSEHITVEATKKGWHVISVGKGKVIRQRILSMLRKIQPGFLVVNGHGNDSCLTGDGAEVIMQAGDETLLKSMIVFARACSSAKRFGQLAIQAGTVAYLGYDDDFWLVMDSAMSTKPLLDKTAEMFIGPSNHIAIALLKGHTAQEANIAARTMYARNIIELFKKGPLNPDYDNIKYLHWNMKHQVCLGDQNAKL
jgi:hypothetical protein